MCHIQPSYIEALYVKAVHIKAQHKKTISSYLLMVLSCNIYKLKRRRNRSHTLANRLTTT